MGMLYAESAVWRRNASYVRFKNLEIGYTFNAQTLRSLGIQKLRVYANAFNIATWTEREYGRRSLCTEL